MGRNAAHIRLYASLLAFVQAVYVCQHEWSLLGIGQLENAFVASECEAESRRHVDSIKWQQSIRPNALGIVQAPTARVRGESLDENGSIDYCLCDGTKRGRVTETMYEERSIWHFSSLCTLCFYVMQSRCIRSTLTKRSQIRFFWTNPNLHKRGRRAINLPGLIGIDRSTLKSRWNSFRHR